MKQMDDQPAHSDRQMLDCTKHCYSEHLRFNAQWWCSLMRCSLFMIAVLCRDALSSGLPGLTFIGYGDSASVTVGYGVAALEPLLPCRTATTLVSPFCSHQTYHVVSAASITCPSCREVAYCLSKFTEDAIAACVTLCIYPQCICKLWLTN